MNNKFSVPSFELSGEVRQELIQIAFSQNEPRANRVRARVLLGHAGGVDLVMIVKYLKVHRAQAIRTIERALQEGVLESVLPPLDAQGCRDA
ncbi:hypothetical protein [Holophaga foetida]|uniref:hypothetical protein n=1 Tax=Holophaga foetida TaxID=35839 RepID=UPI0002471C90|nr:hypothetical protein [Holophaga foetida]